MGNGSANNIVSIDTETGDWSPLGIGTDGFVRALATFPDGDLCVGGDFIRAGGVAASGIARWDGKSWTRFGPESVGSAYAFSTLPNDELVAAGRSFIARWERSMTTPIRTSTNSTVYALTTLPNGDLVAGGTFSIVGGVAANQIARWDGKSWAPLGTGTDGTVFALIRLPSGDLVVGGSFNRAAGVAATNRIARWNGSSWAPLGTGIGGGFVPSVHALETLPNGDLVAAGTFTIAGGQASGSWARWGPRGVAGDADGNRRVDFNDIPCFVAALVGPAAWEACGTAAPANTYFCINDINADGTIDISDIDGFVACLVAGGCPQE